MACCLSPHGAEPYLCGMGLGCHITKLARSAENYAKIVLLETSWPSSFESEDLHDPPHHDAEKFVTIPMNFAPLPMV